MRMYAACLASYNNGCLRGEWFDLEDYSDADELQEAIKRKVLMTSRFPNVTVECPQCDGSGSVQLVRSGASDAQVRRLGLPQIVESHVCPCCAGSGEVPSAEEWAAHDWEGEGLSEFGEYPSLADVFEHIRLIEEHGSAWIAFKDAFGDSVTEENFNEAYRGEYQSEEDFAEEYTCEVQGWNGDEFFYSWIDWKAAWNCSLRFDFTFNDGYVFYSNW